ncbi:MAG: Hsp20/alpha crystallin family protein [Syntrophobacterales bacterium]|jgi:HSP20 family protein
MKWFDDDIDKEFERMRQRMERMARSLTRPGAATLCGDTGWRPSLDLYETDDELTLLVDVSGIKPQDVEVVVEHEVVRISGNRCRPLGEKVSRVHHMEIDFGPFSQAIRLPIPVDPDGSSSTYRDGFLVVHLPKKSRISASVSVKADE